MTADVTPAAGPAVPGVTTRMLTTMVLAGAGAGAGAGVGA